MYFAFQGPLEGRSNQAEWRESAEREAQDEQGDEENGKNAQKNGSDF